MGKTKDLGNRGQRRKHQTKKWGVVWWEVSHEVIKYLETVVKKKNE